MLKYTIPRWIYIHRNSISIFEIWTNHTSHFNWMKRLKKNAERKKFDCTKKKESRSRSNVATKATKIESSLSLSLRKPTNSLPRLVSSTLQRRALLKLNKLDGAAIPSATLFQSSSSNFTSSFPSISPSPISTMRLKSRLELIKRENETDTWQFSASVFLRSKLLLIPEPFYLVYLFIYILINFPFASFDFLFPNFWSRSIRDAFEVSS